MSDIGPTDDAPRRFTLRRAMAVLFGLFVVAGFVAYFLTPPVEVRITEAQAQDALNAQIGTTQRTSYGVGEVTPTRLDPTFRGDNRMALNVGLDITALGRSTQVEGDIKAGIRYRAPRVYLTDIDTSNMRVAPDAPDVGDAVSDMMTVARDKLQREREVMTPDAQAALDRLVGKRAERLPELTARAVTTLIATVPIYDLRDAGLGGSVAALALHDVRFEDGVAVLTLSARRAVLRILAMIGAITLLLLYFGGQPLLGMGLERLLDGHKDPETPPDTTT